MANMCIYPLKSIIGAITELLFILALLFTSNMFVYFLRVTASWRLLWSVNRQETGSRSKLAAADKLSVTQSGFDLRKTEGWSQVYCSTYSKPQMIYHASKANPAAAAHVKPDQWILIRRDLKVIQPGYNTSTAKIKGCSRGVSQGQTVLCI